VTVLFHAHSGLRYLVLLAAAAALIALVAALATRRFARAARVLPAAFTGLLDLQILLGIALVLGGLFPDAVAGHLVLMVLAAAAAHGASIVAKRSADDRRALVVRLAGVALSLALIVTGILAIGRGVFGSAPPSPG
jgi:heme A synthase